MGLTMIGPGGGGKVYWSPYQKLTITPVHQDGELISYQLTTNGSWYQQILDLSPAFVASHAKYFKQDPVEWNAYNLPYHFYQAPPSVLVLGAGTGNDVAGALRNGAGHVTAVEIDPLILKFGQTLHFEKPYGSPRVTTVLDDARSYVETTDERFDMVVFSLLDSHTNSSYYSNIRIDNYVYTVEALQATKRLLKPDGIMVVKFQVSTPWIAGRLYGSLQTSVWPCAARSTNGKFHVYHLGTIFYYRIAGAHRSSFGRTVPFLCAVASGVPDGDGLAHDRRLAVFLPA